MVHKSKIDGWLAAILMAAMAACIGAGMTIVLNRPPPAWWLILPIMGVGVGLPLWIMLGTRYTLDATHLHVRSGPFKWQIPVASIRSITRTSNPLSSPALSLDRLRIDYGRSATIMISPRNKEQFIRDIERLANQSFDTAALKRAG